MQRAIGDMSLLQKIDADAPPTVQKARQSMPKHHVQYEMNHLFSNLARRVAIGSSFPRASLLRSFGTLPHPWIL